MPTNLLSLPPLIYTFETATNESWRDGIPFAVAGSVTGYPAAANIGRGNLSGVSIAPGAYVGDYALTMIDAGSYRVSAPSGAVIGIGTMGAPFTASGLSFLLDYGATAFAPGDTYTFVVLSKPLDITGIRFVMQMRASASSPQPLVTGDTADGTMVNGGASGVLGLAIPLSVMEKVPVTPTGAPYVLDIVAIADGDQRRCLKGTCVVEAAITYPVAD